MKITWALNLVSVDTVFVVGRRWQSMRVRWADPAVLHSELAIRVAAQIDTTAEVC